MSDLEIWSNSSGPERADLIKSVYAEGDSMGSIAAKLSERFGVEITRNAIAGVYNRNKLSLVDFGLRQSAGGKPAPVKPDPVPEPKKTELEIADVEQEPLLIDLMETTNQTCKWPIGQWPGIKFCGVYKEPSAKPYCGYHTKLADQPAKARTGKPFVMRRKQIAAR
jgi:hypothetical protein